MAFFFEYLWISKMEKSQMCGSDKGLKKRKPILFNQFKQQHNHMGACWQGMAYRFLKRREINFPL